MLDAVLDIFANGIGRVGQFDLRRLARRQQLALRRERASTLRIDPRLCLGRMAPWTAANHRKAVFFNCCEPHCPRFKTRKPRRHFPPGRILTTGRRPKSAPRSDGRYLQKLVDPLLSATPVDRSLIEAAIVTPFWGGDSGLRPIFMITAKAGRGAGKSVLAQTIGDLAGGAITVSAIQ